MINFSEISNSSIVGKILRLFLKMIPNNSVMTIKQGVIKGGKWVKGSGVNAYWLGTYEKELQDLIFRTIKEGDVFYDIGSNVGFYSLIASVGVGKSGYVYAFEPVPRNIYYIKEHIRLNKCSNSIVVSGAVSNKTDMSYFNESEHPATGSISQSFGDMLIPTFNLDELVENGKIRPPTIMKIDVEGNEFNVLSGSIKILEKFHPVIFLATHNTEVHKKCINLLSSLRYELKSIEPNKDLDNTSTVLAK